MEKPIVVFHGNCADGYTALWLVNLYFRSMSREANDRAAWHVEPHAGVYGESPPPCRGRHVYIVDFSYKRHVLEWMLHEVNHLTIIDHHATAITDIEALVNELDGSPLLDKLTLHLSTERSGAYLVSKFFWPNAEPLDMVKLVDDRDRWVFADPRSRPFAAGLFSLEYTLENWDYAAQNVDRLVEDGMAIDRKALKDIRELLDQMTLWEKIGDELVPTANLSYISASDACHELLQRYPDAPFAATWFRRKDGKRVFSLRSRTGSDVDVGAIAKQYGGGGHKHSAGFTV